MRMVLATALLAVSGFLAPLSAAERHAGQDGFMQLAQRGEAQAAVMPARLDIATPERATAIGDRAMSSTRGAEPDPAVAWMVAAGIFAIIVLRRINAPS